LKINLAVRWLGVSGLVAAIAMTSLPALARSIIAPTFAESAGRAQYVIVARVLQATDLSSDGTDCGTTYQAVVQSSVKGDLAKGQQVTFGFLRGLDSGATYRLYLMPSSSGKAQADQLRDRGASETEVKSWLSACGAYPQVIHFRFERIGK
jgi:hypothetical protein